ELTGESLELTHQAIAFRPDRDCSAHVAYVPEVPEERRHPRDVVGMNAAAEESLADDLGVWARLLELEACLAVPERNIDRAPVEFEIVFAVRCRIAREVVDARLLRFRPETLAAHVASHRGEDCCLQVGGYRRAADDGDEQEDEQTDAVSSQRGAEDLFRRAHTADRGIPHR